jgi:hypothetical protein
MLYWIFLLWVIYDYLNVIIVTLSLPMLSKTDDMGQLPRLLCPIPRLPLFMSPSPLKMVAKCLSSSEKGNDRLSCSSPLSQPLLPHLHMSLLHHAACAMPVLASRGMVVATLTPVPTVPKLYMLCLVGVPSPSDSMEVGLEPWRWHVWAS